MTKPLIVPKHVAKEKQEKAKGELEKAYVKPDDRVLQPEKLSQSALDKLPQPTGWRILILPYQGKKTSDGGIIIPEEVREREAVGTVCGYVLRVGPLAYQDYSRFGTSGAWCKEKDWVIFGRYAGSRFRIEGGEVRLLNDDEILARISDPNDILHI